jgi:LmbE family N-acetylglucosaminyl deacetylase
MPVLLVVVPHPDDEAYAFGGAIALATRAGWSSVVHCVSAGEKGKRHDGGPDDTASIGRAREAELRVSCRALGADSFCWGLPDGGLMAYRDQYARMASLIRAGADAILTLGPDGAYGHPDHLAVHRWVVAAWQSTPGTRPPLLFSSFPKGFFLPQYEKCRGMLGEPPNPPPESIGTDRWDIEVPIADVADLKLRAIAAHRTQLPGGDPHALFPHAIVAGCLRVERYVIAPGGGPADRFIDAIGATRAPRGV